MNMTSAERLRLIIIGTFERNSHGISEEELIRITSIPHLTEMKIAMEAWHVARWEAVENAKYELVSPEDLLDQFKSTGGAVHADMIISAVESGVYDIYRSPKGYAYVPKSWEGNVMEWRNLGRQARFKYKLKEEQEGALRRNLLGDQEKDQISAKEAFALSRLFSFGTKIKRHTGSQGHVDFEHHGERALIAVNREDTGETAKLGTVMIHETAHSIDNFIRRDLDSAVRYNRLTKNGELPEELKPEMELILGLSAYSDIHKIDESSRHFTREKVEVRGYMVIHNTQDSLGQEFFARSLTFLFQHPAEFRRIAPLTSAWLLKMISENEILKVLLTNLATSDVEPEVIVVIGAIENAGVDGEKLIEVINEETGETELVRNPRIPETPEEYAARKNAEHYQRLEDLKNNPVIPTVTDVKKIKALDFKIAMANQKATKWKTKRDKAQTEFAAYKVENVMDSGTAQIALLEEELSGLVGDYMSCVENTKSIQSNISQTILESRRVAAEVAKNLAEAKDESARIVAYNLEIAQREAADLEKADIREEARKQEAERELAQIATAPITTPIITAPTTAPTVVIKPTPTAPRRRATTSRRPSTSRRATTSRRPSTPSRRPSTSRRATTSRRPSTPSRGTAVRRTRR